MRMWESKILEQGRLGHTMIRKVPGGWFMTEERWEYNNTNFCVATCFIPDEGHIWEQETIR